MFEAIAHCPVGIEPVCADEITSLGLEVRDVLPDQGVVTFTASLRDLFRANLHLRCVGRVSVALAAFPASRFDQLEDQAATIAWERWLDDRRRLLLRVTSRGSKLYHEGAIAERIHAVVERRLGHAVERARGEELDDPGRDVQLVIVRVERNQCLVRLDSSGARLHRRGYREQTAGAPLRETLAAAILRACGWLPHQPLVDPFCGSGTFLIEAAEQSLGLAAGRKRAFALERWPFVDAAEMAELRQQEARRSMPPPPVLYGSDRAAGALRAARGNADRAGVLPALRLEQHPVSRLRAPEAGPGWVVTNPPWGRRLRGGDLRRLYASFGRVLREGFEGWELGILCPDPALLERMGLDFDEGPWLNNGGQHAQLLYASIE
jgi:putative N6-adenine-specific DNA methylase